MINFSVFCPFERIAASIAKWLDDNSVPYDYFTLDLGFGERTFHKNLGYDQDMGYAVKDREDFVSMNSVSGTITVFSDSESKVRKVMVYNSLVTDAPILGATKINGKSVYNGKVGNRKVFYPEAYYTVAQQEFDFKVNREKAKLAPLRPWWNYMLVHTEDGFSVYGPKAVVQDEVSKVCNVKTDLYAGALYDTIFSFVPDTEEVVDHTKPPSTAMYSHVKLVTPEGVVYDFPLGQVTALIGGKRISALVIWCGLLMNAHLERSKSGEFYIHLVESEGEYVLAEHNEVLNIIKTSQFLLDLRESIDYSEHDVFVRRNGQIASLVWVRGSHGQAMNEACFAMSLAWMLSASSSTPYDTFLRLLSNASSPLFVANNGQLHGQTARFEGSIVNFEVVEDGLSRPYRIRRRSVKMSDLAPEQYALLGMEYNSNNNEPDHWIVVVKTSDQRLLVAFNPSLTGGYTEGVDVTQLAAVPGSMLLEFANDFALAGGRIDESSDNSAAMA